MNADLVYATLVLLLPLSFGKYRESPRDYYHYRIAPSVGSSQKYQHRRGPKSYEPPLYERQLGKNDIREADKMKLENIYGPLFVSQHWNDFLQIQKMKKLQDHEHPQIPWHPSSHSHKSEWSTDDTDIVDDAALNVINYDLQERMKGTLSSTTSRLPVLKSGQVSSLPKYFHAKPDATQRNLENRYQKFWENPGKKKHQGRVIRSVSQTSESTEDWECNIHGVWLSPIAGTIIELHPIVSERHIEIKAKVSDIEGVEKGILTSKWTGSGVISPETPTTITIVFQEHVSHSVAVPDEEGNDDEKQTEHGPSEELELPKTAVFVGQCLICKNGPTLQGSWLLFPTSQPCPHVTTIKNTTTRAMKDTFSLLQKGRK